MVGKTSFAATHIYKWLLQPYLSLLWLYLATHFITRATSIDDIDGKSQKTEPKSSRNYLGKHLSQTHATSYLWPGGHTHTHT